MVLTLCNLCWWCFSFHQLAQILHLHSWWSSQLALVVFFLRALAHLLMCILQLALCGGGIYIHTYIHSHAKLNETGIGCLASRSVTSLLGHTSAELKKLSTGVHAPEDGICHNILTTSRQHPLQSTYAALFLNIAAISKKKTCYHCMTSLCCS